MQPDDVVAKSIDELPTLWDGFANLVREGMGIEAFGAQIMNLPPDYETKSHDETDSGQEELYLGLSGSGWVLVGEQRHPLDPEHLVAVGPGVERTLASGPDGARILCVGSVKGGVYEPPSWTQANG